ncbi:MAG: regulatory iron-sulfur-containing complex subunit RicT [Anaerolineae bacterium]|nr:regulatory iron-sulfur-containing complex subunit RicT [Anaerolineae bacterium]
MPKVVGVRFKPVTKVYYFDPTSFSNLKADERVIVETARGRELGLVVSPVHEVSKSEVKGKLKRVIRRASPVDLIQAEDYKAKEPEALEKCKDLVTKMNIPIKVLEANYNFDGSRLLFAFVAEQRVDFRDLVKELARALRTRIEMKQVGARDETKLLDGYGRCGRRLCCSSWLTEFHPVSIRMAKQQGLPLAPSEISGLCGRLLCCLAYEDDFYAEMKKKMPRVNTQMKTADGAIGTVRGVNVIKETVLLYIEEEASLSEYNIENLEPLDRVKKQEKEKRAKTRQNSQPDPPEAENADKQRDKPASRKSGKRRNRKNNRRRNNNKK